MSVIPDIDDPMEKYIKGLKCQNCKHYFSKYCLNSNSASYDEFKYFDDYCYKFELRPGEKSLASFPAQYERDDGSYIFDPHDKAIDSYSEEKLRLGLAADLRRRKADREQRIQAANKASKIDDIITSTLIYVVMFAGFGFIIYIFWPIISDILEILGAIGDLLR